MIIRELIEKLKTFDQNTLIVVGGFDEEGFAKIERFDFVKIVPTNSGNVFGDFRKAKPEDCTPINALHIDHF